MRDDDLGIPDNERTHLMARAARPKMKSWRTAAIRS